MTMIIDGGLIITVVVMVVVVVVVVMMMRSREGMRMRMMGSLQSGVARWGQLSVFQLVQISRCCEFEQA